MGAHQSMIPLQEKLQKHFGFNEFRQGQQQTISQLLDGYSSLAVFPTGSGKSLCYQFTATQLPHLTLVISPLIALMHDQLAFLHSKGIAAASLDSSQDKATSQDVMARVQSGEIKILMISVERFKNERFRRFINNIAISMLVVDEAHCISEWGHNFRPDYLKLPQYQQQLAIPLVLLLTATATRRVQKDMAQKFAIQPQHIVQTGFYRANLDIELMPTQVTQKYALLKQVLNQSPGPSIVYVTQQKNAEDIAQQLKVDGYSAEAYHAGLGNELRSQIQAQFMADETQIIVATIAFGMGIDKSDIRLVVHYDLPKSIENYSQEIGRAGRDNQASRCVLLASLEGLNTLENFVYGDTPEAQDIEQLLRLIDQQSTLSHGGRSWETQLHSLSTQTNIRSLPLKTLLVQLELLNVLIPQYSYYADVRIKWLTDLDSIRKQLPQSMRETFMIIANATQFKKIWGTPDFTQLFDKAGLSRNDVLQVLEYAADQEGLMLESKGLTEVYQVALSKEQIALLTQQLQEYVEDKQTAEIERIATMIRFFQLERCLNHNLARYFGDQDAPPHCGHCSVCRGKPLVFSAQPAQHTLPVDEIQPLMQGLQRALEAYQPNKAPSTVLYTRFLTGLTQPLFTKIKARQLPGFGNYEEWRYRQVLASVEEALQSP